MAIIKAPFNFVPISEKVLFPYWGKQVSQDIPFEDGESGEFILTIKAETPIYIKNGSSSVSTDFSHVNIEGKRGEKEEKQYFIPGTSLKGMFRSILEIMSFAKMNRVNNNRFAVRDLNNPELYTLLNDTANIYCGYLYKIGDAYFIENHGKPYLVTHELIDTEYGTAFVSSFCEGGRCTGENQPSTIRMNCRSAEYKYCKLFGGRSLAVNFDYQLTTNRVISIGNRGGIKTGQLVFTGQASVRKEENGIFSGKYNEFVFSDEIDLMNILEVSENLWNEFRFIYFDQDPKKISTDWKYWKKKLSEPEGRVPVFFRIENDQLKDFGLAFLYKMPCKKHVLDFIPENSNNPEVSDLSETIFGTIESMPLKGRVQIGHALCVNSQNLSKLDKVSAVFGQPMASYYPIYLKQSNPYVTYNSDSGRISGRKRYILKDKNQEPGKGNGNEKMIVNFRPLGKDTEFKASIRFHNLKMIEIGALLSAITFHNNESFCFHSLGLAKPYGYGRISCHISPSNCRQLKYKQEEYLAAFECFMTSFLEEEWIETEQVKSLFTLTSNVVRSENDRFTYMKLKDFGAAKSEQLFLRPFGKELDLSIKPFSAKSLKSLINRAQIIFLNKEASLSKLYSEENDAIRCGQIEQERKIEEERIKEYAIKKQNRLQSEREDKREIIDNENASVSVCIGAKLSAIVVENKKVLINGEQIQLVVPKGGVMPGINKVVEVEIVQISKAGKVCQVRFLNNK